MFQRLDDATAPVKRLANTIVSNVDHAVFCSHAAASAVATDLYESAAGVTYQQLENAAVQKLDDVAAQTRELASAIGSSAANTVGSVFSYVVTPILEVKKSIQAPDPSSYPTQLKNAIPKDYPREKLKALQLEKEQLEKKRLEKEQYERENSPEHILDLLKDVIPGNNKWGANYTSDVIESLETYEVSKHFKVKSFAEFVARKIMEELKYDERKDVKCGVNGIYKYKDLLSSHRYINKIHHLKSGPLDIDTLKDEFKIKYKGDEALLNTIPSNKETPTLSPAGTAYIDEIKKGARKKLETKPGPTIFGVTFTCCAAREGKTTRR